VPQADDSSLARSSGHIVVAPAQLKISWTWTVTFESAGPGACQTVTSQSHWQAAAGHPVNYMQGSKMLLSRKKYGEMWSLRFFIVLECCTRNTQTPRYFSDPFTVVVTDSERHPKV
jgi:hypothetical protein